MTNQENRLTFWALFLSDIGDYLFFSSIAVYLLQRGYGALDAGAALASTALPNTVLGPAFGRWIDRSDKKSAFIALCILLGVAEIILLALTGGLDRWFQVRIPGAYIPWVMMALAMAYSPLQTLIQHYIIPSLCEREEDAYARWEIFHKTAWIIGGALAFLALLKLDASWLIVLDALTFITAASTGAFALRIRFQLERTHSHQQISQHSTSIREICKSLFRIRELRVAVASVIAFAVFAVSVQTNVVSMGEKIYQFTPSLLGLMTSFIGISEWAGAFLYKKLKSGEGSSSRQNVLFLIAHSIPLALMGLATYTSSGLLWLMTVMTIGVLASPWSVSNTLILRKHIPKSRYAEVFGYIRMPRAALTFISTSAIAYAIDRQFLTQILLILAVSLAAFCVLLLTASGPRHAD